jgi:hypothetical protein
MHFVLKQQHGLKEQHVGRWMTNLHTCMMLPA